MTDAGPELNVLALPAARHRSSSDDAITLLPVDHPSTPMFFHCALSARGGSGSAALVFPAGNGRSMIACVRLTIFDRRHACHMGRKVAAYKQAQDELRPSNGQLPSMKGTSIISLLPQAHS